MNKRNAILIFGMLLIALPAFAIINSSSYESGKVSSLEKCSAEIEGLKFCLESSKITVDSGKPVIINMTWSNSSEVLRRVGGIYTSYSVIVKDENRETLIPVREKKILEKQKRMESPDATEEDKKPYLFMIRGGGRGLYLEPKQSDTNRINLSGEYYDYDFTAKGKYNVTIIKTFPSLEKGKMLEFVIEDIEIRVK
ncbi:MAG: hypothetical protein WKF90_04390 [Pyrinomonadaceae bacterium]